MASEVSAVNAATFANSVIGEPYSKTGLHCWELVRRTQAAVFGRVLPAILEAPSNRLALARLMARRHDYAGWAPAQAQHGAVVFMTRRGHGPSRAAIHAGTYLALDGGGVLHTDDPHGVVFETLAELSARNWADLSFYVPT
jgi:hypothetical protein